MDNETRRRDRVGKQANSTSSRLPRAADLILTPANARRVTEKLSELRGFDQGYWHMPPANAIFLHRKLGGLYLLAARLRAKIDVRAILEPHLYKVIRATVCEASRRISRLFGVALAHVRLTPNSRSNSAAPTVTIPK